MDLEEILDHPDLAQTRWSIQVEEVAGSTLLRHAANDLLRTASVAKIFVLIELARALSRGELAAGDVLLRGSVAPVHDSGLWQHLEVDRLCVNDVARLVGTMSDNWAANVLIEKLGLEVVQAGARKMAPHGSMLHDLIRDERTSDFPATVSEGCAADWAAVFSGLTTGRLVGADVGRTVLDWLSTSTDLSMVGAAFGLDPLAHAHPDRGTSVWNKTGTDDGVRADVGCVVHGRESWSYAVICNWCPSDPDPRDAVLRAMRQIGGVLRDRLGNHLGDLTV